MHTDYCDARQKVVRGIRDIEIELRERSYFQLESSINPVEDCITLVGKSASSCAIQKFMEI